MLGLVLSAAVPRPRRSRSFFSAPHLRGRVSHAGTTPQNALLKRALRWSVLSVVPRSIAIFEPVASRTPKPCFIAAFSMERLFSIVICAGGSLRSANDVKPQSKHSSPPARCVPCACACGFVFWFFFFCSLGGMDQALYLITTGARESSFRNIKTIAECLADEIINAARGSSNSYAIKKKDEIERVAKANR